MIGSIEGLIRSTRRRLNRSYWAIRLLGLSKLDQPIQAPGLIMVQIDGLSLTQVQNAMRQGNVPFLSRLLSRESYVLHTFFSGIPSNTPAVQAEIFYGVKTCVPSFYFMDRRLCRPVKMQDAAYVEQFEQKLKEKNAGLLSGGSSYSNIFTGGASEAHFCWAQLGFGGVLHAANPLVFPFLFLLYIDIFVRTFVLLIVEFLIAFYECIRGTLKGRLFFEELRFVMLRVLVCIFLRELIVAGVCIDIMRGLPVIHCNFLGYDEQAHCRGPSSRFAHWALQGIDAAIKRIDHTMKQSPYREYDLWVYGDHGQETTTPYFIRYGRTIEEAVQELFGKNLDPVVRRRNLRQHNADGRADLLVSRKDKPLPRGEQPEILVTAMGPLGQIYVKKKLSQAELEFFGNELATKLHIPLVVIRQGQKLLAYTPHGSYTLPDQTALVFGEDHPFLEDIQVDFMTACFHPDAGEFIIAGWSKGESPISFPLEYGAHAAMSVEETRAFALMPVDAPLKSRSKKYLRPLDLRDTALRYLNKEVIGPAAAPEEVPGVLRLMSYNVHGCKGMDGYLSTERIARVIARHRPDVIALQELDVGRARSQGMDQVQKVAKYLEMKYHFHPVLCQEAEQYGNAILSRYPVTLIKVATLPGLHDQEPRGAMWVQIEFQNIGVHVINTHLSIWPRERMLQVKALLSEQWIGQHDHRTPLVLCGDFNAMPGSSSYKRICQKLKDSQTLLNGHQPFRTWFGRYPVSQIDHVFVNPQLKVHAASVPHTSLDKVASDHLPLIVDLKMYVN